MLASLRKAQTYARNSESNSGYFRKRGFFETRGEEEENLKNPSGQKDNEASGSGKDKGKIVSEKYTDENPKMTESERAVRKKKDKELDELNALMKKLDAKEAEVKNSKLILENQKTVFLYAKPQYESWSLKRIMGLKVGLLVQRKDFLNVHLKGFQGANHVLHEFTLADLPFVNPYDWISLFYIVAKDVNKYDPICEH
ncbi:unnamed protein product [Lactuca saligna]|uniref:Uncharacterized protein n=1 Tax=Lactuca saligna TaxID=75948 RepID=A0AA36EA67_LACSI|nr:unnamed protein product [Lactuca saligna]